MCFFTCNDGVIKSPFHALDCPFPRWSPDDKLKYKIHHTLGHLEDNTNKLKKKTRTYKITSNGIILMHFLKHAKDLRTNLARCSIIKIEIFD